MLSMGIFACSSTPSYENKHVFLDNSLITAKVKNQLINDLMRNGYQIKVKTLKSVVYLTGYVHSDQIKQQATLIAQNVAGVQSVQNDLIIQNQ